MPLSPPAPRALWHERTVRCRGYRRDDGLWDIEGSLTDTKTYSFANHDRDGIAAGEPVHGMAARLTVDDGLAIRDAEAAIDHGPFHPCAEAAGGVRDLVGATIRPGFRRTVQGALGGTAGCTHLRTLLEALAQTAAQTVPAARDARVAGDGDSPPALLGSCHALRRDGPVARREWPEWAAGDGDE